MYEFTSVHINYKMMSTLLYLYNTIKRGDVLTLTDSLECRHDFLDINTILPTYGVGILHLAVGIEPFSASAQCVEVILKNGGDPNLRSDEGLTPVHIAANWGRLENLKVLLAWGGDISVRDGDQNTPYDYAVKEGHWDICDYLLDTVANGLENDRTEPSHILSLEKKNLHKCDESYKYNSQSRKVRKSGGCCRKSQMVEDWCNQKLHLCNTHHTIYNDHSMLVNESILWSSKLIPMHSTDNSNSHLDHTEKCDDSVYTSDFIPERNITLEKLNYTKLSGIDEIEFSCNSDNAIYSCLNSENEKSDNTKVYIMRQGLFKQFSLPGSPTNIVHKNYLNKSNIKKIYCVNKQDENETSLNILDGDLEIEGISDRDLYQQVVDIEDKCTPFNEVNIDKIREHKCATPPKSQNVITRTPSINVRDKCDSEQNQALLEERLLLHDKKCPMEIINVSSSSDGKSSVASATYDLARLRLELTQCGYKPGPINHSTKRIYLKKLRNLRRKPIEPQNSISKTYSLELQRTLSEGGWCETAWREAGGTLERTAAADFARRETAWPEGKTRTSFTYLLLDPRITRDLPARAPKQPDSIIWQTFVDSIFYVGKGKRSRPYSHLYQAISLWKENFNKRQVVNKKVQHILDVWMSGSGVVCLHVFQNVIPAEAYTYEAAMIEVLGLTNLKNLKTGNYYGVVSSWPLKDRRRLGVYLLYKAMHIFLSEGERQLRPEDLD